MANEEGKAHIWKQHLVCCVVISWLVASGASGVRPLERGATNGDSPVQRLPAPCTARALRVAFPGMGALIRWYISSKAKYLLESDSEQVPWGKDAKYFEKRVICAWNHCITSTWILLFRWISATYGARGIWRLLPMQLKRQPNTRFGELSERSGWFMSDVNFGFLDRRIFLHSVSGSEWLRMRWSLSWLRCKARVIRGIGTKRFQMTRLETRTKESTHVCEYVPWNGMCVVKVTVIIFVVTTDFNFRREVWV